MPSSFSIYLFTYQFSMPSLSRVKLLYFSWLLVQCCSSFIVLVGNFIMSPWSVFHLKVPLPTVIFLYPAFTVWPFWLYSLALFLSFVACFLFLLGLFIYFCVIQYFSISFVIYCADFICSLQLDTVYGRVSLLLLFWCQFSNFCFCSFYLLSEVFQISRVHIYFTFIWSVFLPKILIKHTLSLFYI